MSMASGTRAYRRPERSQGAFVRWHLRGSLVKGSKISHKELSLGEDVHNPPYKVDWSKSESSYC